MNKNLKITLFGLAFILTIPKIFAGNSNSFGSLTVSKITRPCDPLGCGYFGAARGVNEHKGIDFIVYENQGIKAPFDCRITRYGFPYLNDPRYRLVEIQGLKRFSDYTAKIFYIKISHPIGTTISKGSTICLADDISIKFDSRMQNHIHFELYKNGILIDPTPYF